MFPGQAWTHRRSSAAFDVDIDAGSAPGSHFVEIAGEHDTIFHFVAIDVKVEDNTPVNLVFADGFESGDLSAWSE